MQYAAANNLISDLVEVGIFTRTYGYSRNRYFAMDDYIKLFGKQYVSKSYNYDTGNYNCCIIGESNLQKTSLPNSSPKRVWGGGKK